MAGEAWKIGLLNIHIPEAFGGLGLSALDVCVIDEEFGKECRGITTTLNANSLMQIPVAFFGDKEQNICG